MSHAEAYSGRNDPINAQSTTVRGSALRQQLSAQRKRIIAIVKRTLDDCTHPECIADRKRRGYSNCAGGQLARAVVNAIKDDDEISVVEGPVP